MKFIDLSQPLFNNAPNCPTHPVVSIRVEKHTSDALNSWQIEHLSFPSHTGSHIDAPLHKIRGGAGIEDYPLEHWCGEAVLVDLRHLEPKTEITVAHFEGIEVRNRIVLLATGWGEKRAKNPLWWDQSPRLGNEGAKFLVENGARAVGIDHFSVGGSSEPRNAHLHQILLSAGIWIIEELGFPPEIWEVPQPFHFQALPINLRGCDGLKFSGAPCRPVAVLP